MRQTTVAAALSEDFQTPLVASRVQIRASPVAVDDDESPLVAGQR
jgi:hypothetical protein